MKNSKSGMSLVELVISIAVTSLIVGAVVTLVFFGIKNYGDGINEVQGHQNVTIAESLLHTSLKSASGVVVSMDPPVNGQVTFYCITEDSKVVLFIQQKDGKAIRLPGIKSAKFSLAQLVSGHYRLDYEFIADNGYKLFGGIVVNNLEGASLFSDQKVDLTHRLHISY